MKNWLMERLLPMWAKETLLADNRALRRENAWLRQQNREKNAYIRGLHKGLRRAAGNRRPPRGGARPKGGKKWTS